MLKMPSYPQEARYTMPLCQPVKYYLLGKITYESELPLLTRQTFHPRVRIQSY